MRKHFVHSVYNAYQFVRTKTQRASLSRFRASCLEVIYLLSKRLVAGNALIYVHVHRCGLGASAARFVLVPGIDFHDSLHTPALH